MWQLQHTRPTFPSALQLFCSFLVCALLHSFQCFSIVHAHADKLRLADSGIMSFPVYHQSFDSADPSPHDAQTRHGTLYPSRAHSSFSASTSSLDSAPQRRLASSNVPQLRSELITLAQPFVGKYFAKLQIGTPAKDIALIISTASDLVWIQCTPCVQCTPQATQFPIFNPATSSSFEKMMCGAAMCKGNSMVRTGCTTSSNACAYEVIYGDDPYYSNSSGILVRDALTFTTSNAASSSTAKGSSSFTLPDFVFGCGFYNEGNLMQFKASGVMGLDRFGPYSLISQLGVDVFSYCLPNRAHTADVSGYLTFGNPSTASSSSSSKPSLQYTPIIQNEISPDLPLFYYLNLIGISVNAQLLDIPAAAFEIDVGTGSGGTIIDTATTSTIFVDEAYEIIIEAFEEYMGTANYKKQDLEEVSTQLCYEVPLSMQRGAPTALKMTLHFEGSADMELGADQLFYLYASDSANNYYCVALGNGGTLASGAHNTIGNFQQQDFLVEYDLANSRLGFAAAQCTSTPSRNYSPSFFTVKPMWYLAMSFITCLPFLL